MRWKSMSVSGWGRNCAADVLAARPERVRDAVMAMQDFADGSIVAHGAGRSYGDAALNQDGRIILTERLNRILAFDQDTGEIVVEPGVTFRDLLDVFLPRGFITPVSPGTAFATIGGAIANDVHGKNHDVVGSFGDHVQWIDLLLPSGEVVRASPSENRAVFEATVGGIGLTGVILAAGFRMLRVSSNGVRSAERRIPSLEEFLQAFAEPPADGMQYSIGWIDGLAKGKALGRGVLEQAVPAATDQPEAPGRGPGVPVDIPGFVLNSWSVRAFNETYFRRIPTAGRERDLAYADFLYPLDAIADWNRLYGKRGFYQFQCVLPRESGERGLPRLLERIAGSGKASFLAVLKTLGGSGPGHLSFPMKGYTLALDFPRRNGVEELLDDLERTTLDHGGRIYLAKDSRLSPEGFAAMYPRLGELRSVLEDIDPAGRMLSSMARRLQIREGIE